MIDYALASEGIINNVLHFRIEIEIISNHMRLLEELDNIIQERNENNNAVNQAQSQKLIGYKWKDKCKSVFAERPNDTAGNLFMWGIHDCVN